MARTFRLHVRIHDPATGPDLWSKTSEPHVCVWIGPPGRAERDYLVATRRFLELRRHDHALVERWLLQARWYTPTLLRRTPFFALALLVACTELRFEGTGGAGATGASGGAGASTTTSSGAGGMGGTGAGGCTAEVCDGLDNDCNGVADDPPEGSGSFCDCEWLSFDDKLYVACPTAASYDELECPLGTELVVLQSAAEQEALAPLVPEDHSGFVALRQADGASNPRAGWNWVGRIGMPPAWGVDQPNDISLDFAESVEADRQQCGYLFRHFLGEYHLADGACMGEANTLVLCEAVREDCVEAAPCTRGAGCNGVVSCAGEPACNGVGAGEACNGLDDNCDTTIGNDGCACAPFSSPSGRNYKLCVTPARPSGVECGEGFRLAVPTTAEEFTFLRSTITTGSGDERWIGGFQTLGTATPGEGWLMLDGSTLLLNQWDFSEPSDNDDIEDGEQDCLFLDETGLRDGTCSTMRPAFCEEVP